MNKIFHYGIILFIIVGLIFNKQEAMLKALLQTPFDVFELCKTLILSICLWNGLLKIIQASNMMNHLNFLFKPLLRWIYGRCIQDEQIYQALSSNLIANLLGLGTLATMSGLQAISKLKEDRWVDTVKVGSATAYCVNEKVVWQAARDQRKHAIFSATIIASESEQPSDYHLKAKEELKHIPFVKRGEILISEDSAELVKTE